MGKNPFIITYTREIENKSDSEILNNFKVNFERSNCDKLFVLSNKKIIVENSMLRFTVQWNKWNGISIAELTIIVTEDEKKKKVEYKVDFTRKVAGYIFSFILLSIIALVNIEQLLIGIGIVFFLILYFGLGILFLPKFNDQKDLFNETLDKGVEGENLGNYNWVKILSEKTDKELLEISAGRTDLPETIEKLAFYELEKRKNKN